MRVAVVEPGFPLRLIPRRFVLPPRLPTVFSTPKMRVVEASPPGLSARVVALPGGRLSLSLDPPLCPSVHLPVDVLEALALGRASPPPPLEARRTGGRLLLALRGRTVLSVEAEEAAVPRVVLDYSYQDFAVLPSAPPWWVPGRRLVVQVERELALAARAARLLHRSPLLGGRREERLVWASTGPATVPVPFRGTLFFPEELAGRLEVLEVSTGLDGTPPGPELEPVKRDRRRLLQVRVAVRGAGAWVEVAAWLPGQNPWRLPPVPAHVLAHADSGPDTAAEAAARVDGSPELWDSLWGGPTVTVQPGEDRGLYPYVRVYVGSASVLPFRVLLPSPHLAPLRIQLTSSHTRLQAIAAAKVYWSKAGTAAWAAELSQ